MRKRERLLAVWVSYNIWKILNLESKIFKTSRGLTFRGGLSFSGVCIFEKPRGSEFSRHPVLRIFRGSVFSIHPGSLSFRYTQGVCVFDTLRGSVFFGGSVFSIHPGGLRFWGGLCFRYTQGVRDFWGVCVFDTPRGSEFFGGGLCFQCAQGSEFFGVWELCFRGLSFRNTPNLLCFAYRIK